MNGRICYPYRWMSTVFSLLMLLLVPAGLQAEEGLQGLPLSYEITDYLTVEMPGYYRFRFTHLAPITVSEIPTGERAGEQVIAPEIDYTEHRFRLNPEVVLFDQLSLNFQLDVLTGMLTGDTAGRSYMWFASPEQRWNYHNGLEVSDFMEYHFRRFWAVWNSPVGLLSVGRQGSEWGLGILANDGNGFPNVFGDSYYGDSTDRVLFGTKPISIVKYIATGEKPDIEKDPLTVAFAYDWNVYRDMLLKRIPDKEALENAGTPENPIYLYPPIENDDAHEYVGAIRVDMSSIWETMPLEGGFYVVKRYQRHFDALLPPEYRPDQEFLDVWVFDVYGKLGIHPRSLGGWKFFAEGELAFVTGETNLTVSKINASPIDPYPVSDVEQLGWTLRGGVGYKKLFTFDFLNLGYASGDSNPLDGQVRNFKFHPDYNVGLIMFENLLAEMSAESAANATMVFDEGGPIRTQGADLLPTNGSVTNAFYVNPVVRVYPIENLEAMLGFLWARTATNFVDPTIDYLYAGGYGLLNPLGGPSSNSNLGYEIDVGANYTFDLWKYAALVLGVQYGHLFPGNAFANAQGQIIPGIDAVQCRFTLLW